MSDESTWDWDRVRAGYEQGGLSLRSLAAASGHKKSTIQSRAKAEKWVKPDGFRPPPSMLAEVDEVAEKLAEVVEEADEVAELSDDELAVVTHALRDLAHHLTDNDWSIFTPDELAILQPIFERALTRQQKKPENVTAFRKKQGTP